MVDEHQRCDQLVEKDIADVEESDEETNEFLHPDFPLRVRERGKEAFGQGNYSEALRLWGEGLKESLKRSVRTPSAALYKNQWICRLNMAMACVKLDQWVEAKGHLEIVLEQKPHNIKALCRLCAVHEHLQEWDECEKLFTTLLAETERWKEAEAEIQAQTIAPEEDAQTQADKLEILRTRLVEDKAGFVEDDIHSFVAHARSRIGLAKKAYNLKAKKVFKGIGSKLGELDLSADRTLAEKAVSTPVPKREKRQLLEGAELEAHKRRLDNSGPVVRWQFTDSQSTSSALTICSATEALKTDESLGQVLEAEAPKQIIQEATSSVGKGVDTHPLKDFATPILKVRIDEDSEVLDDPNSPLWKERYTVAKFQKDKRALLLSQPLTVVRAIELLTSKEGLKNRDADLKTTQLGDISEKVRLTLLEHITLDGELTIHVIGARGDVEMESQWTSVLRRVPSLKLLRIVFIGFNDADDKWGRALKEGVLSPPLAKTQGLEKGQKLVCFLFKGLYQLFLEASSGVLADDSHPLHPSLCFIPEPNLSQYFAAWLPALNSLLRSPFHTPVVFTGYSLVDQPTHDATTLPHVIDYLEGQWLLPIQPNPYAVKVTPEPECPPMPIWIAQDTPPIFSSAPSAKNAVLGCAVGVATTTMKLAPQPSSDEITDFVDKAKTFLEKVCNVDEAEFLKKNKVQA